jgi:hypothetical protein
MDVNNIVEWWLRDECRISQIQYTLSSTPTMIAQPDPGRFLVAIISSSSNPVFITATTNNKSFPFTAIPPSGQVASIDRSEYGMLVTQSLWAYVGTGTPTLWTTTLSMGDIQRRAYDEYLKHWLSHFKSL